MKENKKSLKNELVEFLYWFEHELAGWKYYKAINGKSIIATIFFCFLKYINDCSKKANNDEIDIYGEIYGVVLNNKCNEKNIIYDYLHKKISAWEDNGEVVLHYIERINVNELPREFCSAVDRLYKYDLSVDVIRECMIDAISELCASLYGNISFQQHQVNDDMYIMHIVGEVLNCQSGMKLYDFSCGTGGLLGLSSSEGCEIYAQEREFEKAAIAYMYLKMAKNSSVCVTVGDVLEAPMTYEFPNLKFDRIICAPPIKQKYKLRDIIDYKYIDEFQCDNKLLKSEFWIYARHMLKKLKDGGRAVLVAPISVLSKEGETQIEREKLIKSGVVDSIIQLPVVTSITMASLCLIILRKNQYKTDNTNIYCADFSSKRSENILEISQKNLCVEYKRISDIVNNRDIIQGVSRNVPVDEFIHNELNLTPAIYFRDMSEIMESKEYTVDMLMQRKQLLNQYSESEKKLNASLWNYYQLWGKP